MAQDREADFKQLVADFPDSPMGHFSLGKLYLEQRRYPEAIQALERACTLDPEYAAALVSLGDAYAGGGNKEKARETFGRAHGIALAQKHPSLAEEIEERISEL